MKTSLLIAMIFAVVSLVKLSSCSMPQLDWDGLDFTIPPRVDSPPPGSIVPFVNIDSVSSGKADSVTLWMSLTFLDDSTLIFKNYSIDYWESELPNPMILNKVFEVDYDTVDFGLSSAFVFSASFGGLKTETSYMFCFVGRDYYESDIIPAGNIYGNCYTFRTGK